MGLEIRFYRRTKNCSTSGYILQTPFDDPEDAKKFAEEKFRTTIKGKEWKIDKGFLKMQINMNKSIKTKNNELVSCLKSWLKVALPQDGKDMKLIIETKQLIKDNPEPTQQ